MVLKTSIIIPVYNGERYLSAAIESVLAQTMPDFELIVWDDGSLDNSLDIAYRYAKSDKRVKVIAAEHRGIAASINAAIARTTGTYIGCVDSDDLLAPTALQEAKLVLDTHQETGLVYTDYIVIDGLGKQRKYGGRCTIPYSKEKLLLSFMTFHFRLFRRCFFEQVGGADESLECAVDYDLCLKLSEVTAFTHLPKPLYYYRSHLGSVSHQKRVQQIYCSRDAVQKALERRGMSDDFELELQIESRIVLRKKQT
ncbi:MAG: glycosyltransferase [Cyanosarcina radialis HA8281-LM2]|nr:glycosyltransferase [Cyanosarcina radialis HA8281-LM2]